MIFDTLDHLESYACMHTNFQKVITFLETTDMQTLSDGIHKIDDDTVFVIIETTMPQNNPIPILEAHRKYIDIQCTLHGEFSCGWKSLNYCKNIKKEYNPKKDIIFFDDAPILTFPIPQHHFAIFFPDDAHAPMAPLIQTKKAIFKIALNS